MNFYGAWIMMQGGFIFIAMGFIIFSTTLELLFQKCIMSYPLFQSPDSKIW